MLQVPPLGQQPSPALHWVMVVTLHARLQLAALPVGAATVHGLLSVQEGQEPGGSQVSPVSTMPLPQPAQSLSLPGVQVVGQQPSPFAQALMVTRAQAKLQVAALPLVLSIVQALVSTQLAGSGHELGGSQVSPDSSRPLPQPRQSLSFAAVQPGAQQPSPFAQLVMVWCVQLSVQDAALPAVPSMVHALESLQLSIWHMLGGSQVSPPSRVPLPQVGEQSLSVLALQPGGQQLSPFSQAVMVWCAQADVQLAGLPVGVSRVHATPSLQLIIAHALGGSQVSPASTIRLPQLAEQLLSLVALQPPGQQPSPFWQVVMV